MEAHTNGMVLRDAGLVVVVAGLVVFAMSEDKVLKYVQVEREAKRVADRVFFNLVKNSGTCDTHHF